MPIDPLISIIVPTRNRAQLLELALVAIDRQEFRQFETIVVDDGSEEETKSRYPGIFSPLATKPVLIELASSHPFGNGPSFVRNAGVAASAGELVAFCDDDDFWCDPMHLAIASQRFADDRMLDYYFANQLSCRNGEPVGDNWLPSLTAALSGRAGDAQGIYDVSAADILAEGHFPHLNTTICRKSFWLALGGLWENVRYSEDLDFFVRAADGARHIAFRNVAVATHNIPDRKRSDNASTRLNDAQKLLTMIQIANHLRLTCTQTAALRFAGRHEGWSFKKLAETMSESGNDAAALQFAVRGLAALPTPGWAGKTLLFALKRWFGGRKG